MEWHVMPRSFYFEPSGPLENIDGESDSPVLVHLPPPCTVQDSLPPSVYQDAEPSTGGQNGSPTEDEPSILDLSDVTTELEKLESTGSDYQDLTSPAPMIPGCLPPRIITPALSPLPENPITQDGAGAAPAPLPFPETVPDLPHMPLHGGPISPYQATSKSFSPPIWPVEHARMSNNSATNHVPRRSHYSELSDSPSRGSSSPEIVVPQIIPVTPTMSYWAGMRRRGPEITPGPLSPRSLSPSPSGPSPPPIPVLPPSGYQRPMAQPISASRFSYPVPGFPMPMSPVRHHFEDQLIPQVIHHYHTSNSASSEDICPSIVCATASPTCSSSRIGDPPTRDDELWFEDGNITLTTENVEFRVYKGPLLSLSPILKARCESAHLGYISLRDTSPEDLRHVLRFVYGGTSRVEPSFEEISAHIHFGHKYKAEKLLQRSLDYLRKFYVTDLAAWLQLPSLDPPFFEPAHAIGVVNLAHVLGKSGDVLLPIALMRCCTLGAKILDGFPREDDTEEILSPADLGRCFEGRVKLLEASVRATETLRTHMTSDECSRPPRCKAALQRFVSELVGSEDGPTSDVANELRCLRWDLSLSLSSRRAYLQEAGAAVVGDEKLCTKCFARQLEEQRKIFARLPELMGVSVEGWATAG